MSSTEVHLNVTSFDVYYDAGEVGKFWRFNVDMDPSSQLNPIGGKWLGLTVSFTNGPQFLIDNNDNIVRDISSVNTDISLNNLELMQIFYNNIKT